MSLTAGAQKLLDWLGLYKITATEYKRRISGDYDSYYNMNWFMGDFNSRPRIKASPQRGAFKSELAELVYYSY